MIKIGDLVKVKWMPYGKNNIAIAFKFDLSENRKQFWTEDDYFNKVWYVKWLDRSLQVGEFFESELEKY